MAVLRRCFPRRRHKVSTISLLFLFLPLSPSLCPTHERSCGLPFLPDPSNPFLLPRFPHFMSAVKSTPLKPTPFPFPPISLSPLFPGRGAGFYRESGAAAEFYKRGRQLHMRPPRPILGKSIVKLFVQKVPLTSLKRRKICGKSLFLVPPWIVGQKIPSFAGTHYRRYGIHLGLGASAPVRLARPHFFLARGSSKRAGSVSLFLLPPS